MIDDCEKINLKNIRFKSVDGLSLSGYLFLPKQTIDSVIISIHGPQGALNREREQKFAYYCSQSNLPYFVFTNRSSAILERFNKTDKHGNITRVLYGSANDNLCEGLYDVKGAVDKMLEIGYSKIILLAHSLSCNKIFHYLDVYGNKNIKAICLLSPADIYNYQKKNLGESYNAVLTYAKENINSLELINNGTLEITTKTFCEYSDEGSITRYTNYKKDFLEEWKNLPENIFISFVGINEVLDSDPKVIFDRMKARFPCLNIVSKFYPHARHSYGRVGSEVIEDIVEFIKNIEFKSQNNFEIKNKKGRY